MSRSANSDLVRRLVDEVWNAGNDERLDTLLVDATGDSATGQRRPDSTDIRTTLRLLHTGLPDWHVSIDELIALPDRVLTRWRAKGTHRGPFMGLPATGRRVTVSGISIYHLVDGRLEEAQVCRDSLSMLRQVCLALTSKLGSDTRATGIGAVTRRAAAPAPPSR